MTLSVDSGYKSTKSNKQNIQKSMGESNEHPSVPRPITACIISIGHYLNYFPLMSFIFKYGPHNICLHEPPHEKTNNLHYVKTKMQISFAVTAKLISAFAFTIRIVQFLFFLNLRFLASSHVLCLYSSRSVCRTFSETTLLVLS